MARQKYSATLGGHAPGYLRDALEACLLTCSAYQRWWLPLAGKTDHIIEFDRAEQQEWWDSQNAVERGRWLVGQLWNCTDSVTYSLGMDVRAALQTNSRTEPHVGTYAQVARLLRKALPSDDSAAV